MDFFIITYVLISMDTKYSSAVFENFQPSKSPHLSLI